ncbi:MAG: cupin [Verrucomicrobiota bacterium]
MGYRYAEASEIEPWGTMRRVRRELGVTAFGVNQHELPPDWGDYPEHDETDTGHEEVYACVAGGGFIVVDGERVPLGSGAYVLVDPESRRKLVAGPDGLTCIVIGAAARDRHEGRDTL